jgi:hypothetical protein
MGVRIYISNSARGVSRMNKLMFAAGEPKKSSCDVFAGGFFYLEFTKPIASSPLLN